MTGLSHGHGPPSRSQNTCAVRGACDKRKTKLAETGTLLFSDSVDLGSGKCLPQHLRDGIIFFSMAARALLPQDLCLAGRKLEVKTGEKILVQKFLLIRIQFAFAGLI